jgi:hypothetical protein
MHDVTVWKKGKKGTAPFMRKYYLFREYINIKGVVLFSRIVNEKK